METFWYKVLFWSIVSRYPACRLFKWMGKLFHMLTWRIVDDVAWHHLVSHFRLATNILNRVDLVELRFVTLHVIRCLFSHVSFIFNHFIISVTETLCRVVSFFVTTGLLLYLYFFFIFLIFFLRLWINRHIRCPRENLVIFSVFLLFNLLYFGAFFSSFSLDYIYEAIVRIRSLVRNFDLGYWNCVNIWSAISLCYSRSAFDRFFLRVDRDVPFSIISIDVVLIVRDSRWSIFATFISLVLEFTHSRSVKRKILRCSLLFCICKLDIFICLRCQSNEFTGNGGSSGVWFALKTVSTTRGDAAVVFWVSFYMKRLVIPVLGLVFIHKIFIATLLDHWSQLNYLIWWVGQLIGVAPGERWMFTRATCTFFVGILAIREHAGRLDLRKLLRPGRCIYLLIHKGVIIFKSSKFWPSRSVTQW